MDKENGPKQEDLGDFQANESELEAEKSQAEESKKEKKKRIKSLKSARREVITKLEKSKRKAEAIAELESNIEKRTDVSWSVRYLSYMARASGDKQKAEQILTSALESNPGDTKSIVELTKLLRKEKRTEEAEKYLKNGLSITGLGKEKRLNLLIHLASLELKKSDFENAKQHLDEAYKIWPKSPIVNYELAYYYLQTNEYEKAKEHLVLCEQKEPKNILVLDRLAEASYLTKDFEKALKCYLKIIEVNSSFLSEEDWVSLLDCEIFLQKYGLAEQHLKKSLKRFPQNTSLMSIKAEVLLKQKKVEESIQVAESTLNLKPTSIRSLIRVAQIGIVGRRPDIAEKALDSALTKRPDNYKLNYIHAKLLVLKGEGNKALQVLIGLIQNEKSFSDVKSQKYKLRILSLLKTVAPNHPFWPTIYEQLTNEEKRQLEVESANLIDQYEVDTDGDFGENAVWQRTYSSKPINRAAYEGMSEQRQFVRELRDNEELNFEIEEE